MPGQRKRRTLTGVSTRPSKNRDSCATAEDIPPKPPASVRNGSAQSGGPAKASVDIYNSDLTVANTASCIAEETAEAHSATVGDVVHDSAAGSGVVETTAPAAAVGGGDGRRRRPADAAMEGEPFSHMIHAATNTSPPSRGSTRVEIGGYSFDVPADLVQCFEIVQRRVVWSHRAGMENGGTAGCVAVVMGGGTLAGGGWSGWWWREEGGWG
ncbi:uncharacterized protein H6S33_008070 [Morchella sextelata]|uniref:uncharacterized protein n=1 Tax=Morchella sextelata TaxID=1174677 RepID=UPI001D05AB33|nr:uncharacterized protein H6S33_008070 [Morchella sextelata]KAH0603066.1 hypothetical protein H6S33_008070 [Morchella sextelata]